MHERLAVLRRTRLALAGQADAICDAISPDLARTPADTLAAELLPLLAAVRFLEREASSTLAPRPLGRRGLPFWLGGVHSTVERVPLGRVLVIGPANYPLFLPGVQVLQALAAGNQAIWKPGRGGRAVALVVASALQEAGLPEGTLEVTDESVQAAHNALAGGVEKIIFTGSGVTGRAILRAAAETATPVVAELSGCDAVYVLPGADHARVLEALSFGMRMNGSATCMAPRRLMLIGSGHDQLLTMLRTRFTAMDAVAVPALVLTQLRTLLAEAEQAGASVHGDASQGRIRPILVTDATPAMRLTQSDVFAPVLAAIHLPDTQAAQEADRLCPFGLTAAVFGPEQDALAFSRTLTVGTVLINDLIAPTADPRVPFGGRRGSGFGVTRGREGLLEMTAARTVLVRRGRDTRHYTPTGEAHRALFTGVLGFEHSANFSGRFAGLRKMIDAAKRLR